MSDKKYSTTSSPWKKNSRGQLIECGQKIMIINFYRKLMSDNSNIKYCDLTRCISSSLGIGLNTVQATISEYRLTKTVTFSNRKKRKTGIVDKIDDYNMNAIRKKVHSFWRNQKLPTISKVIATINKDKTLPNMSESYLRKVLKSLHFQYTHRKDILYEGFKVKNWRRKYLKSIRQFRREGRPIYYLGETWLNTADCLNKICIHKNVTKSTIVFPEQPSISFQNSITGNGKRLIILHIRSEAGSVPGGLLCLKSIKNTDDDYENLYEIDCQIFNAWFEKILPLLDTNAVVVLENAPHYSMLKEKVPTMSWIKADIVEWLQSKGEEIGDPTQLLKSELLDIVQHLKPKYESYVIDDIAKNAGKLVLRLPSFHCDLNPTKLVLPMIKQYVKSKNTTCKITDVKHLIHQAINNINPEHWQSLISYSKNEEKNLWDIDFIFDELTDKLQTDPNHIFTTVDSTDSSDDNDNNNI